MIKESGYEQALLKVLNIRLQRKKIYGDSWKKTPDWELLAMIKQKYGRLEDFIINKKNPQLYENETDTIVDLINYSLFLLQNKINKRLLIKQ